MRGLFRCLPAALLGFAVSSYAHDIVSAGPDMLPLDSSPISNQDGSTYYPLDVSADGRYVLFANHDPVATVFFDPNADECRVYRKDRSNGDLVVVFDSGTNSRSFCNGARMSADGNIVAASPSSVPTNPDGELVERDGETLFSFGDVVALTVKDIAAGTETDILTEFLSARPVILPASTFGGYPIRQLNADGNAAIISIADVRGGSVVAIPALVDITAMSVDDDLLRFIDPGEASPFLTGAALNGNGNFLALSVSLSTTMPNPDPPPVPWFGPWEIVETENAVFRVNRLDESVIKAFLADEPEPILGLNTAGRIIREGALSFSGNTVSWVEAPPMCVPEAPVFGGRFESCAPDLPLRACEGEECEPIVRRYSFQTSILNSQRPVAREESKPGSIQDIQISSNALWMLFSRKVVNPFGDDYEIPETVGIPPDGYICINKDSVDSGSGVPVEETCAITNPGPIPPPGAPVLGVDYTELTAPKIWVMRNLQTGVEFSVSTHDDGFQASRAIISDDAATVVYESRDPRLRDDDLSGTNFIDESLLDDACFWPDGPEELSIRAVTNDNARFFTADTQYIYEFMPVFCPAPTPALDANIFASEVLIRVTDAEPPRRSSGGSAPGLWLLLLLGWYGVTRYLRRTD